MTGVADQLTEWSQSPGSFDADGWESPTAAAIATFAGLADLLPKPDLMTSNGEGGIVIEYGDLVEIEIDSTGEAECCIYFENNLIDRFRVK